MSDSKLDDINVYVNRYATAYNMFYVELHAEIPLRRM